MVYFTNKMNRSRNRLYIRGDKQGNSVLSHLSALSIFPMAMFLLSMAVSMHPVAVMAQPNMVFQNIGMQNGLSYNTVNNMCLDRRGKLWISTNRGVNAYNGHTMEKFMAEAYPALQNNFISRVVCDHSNRIWIQAAYGNISMIDESRKVHRIGLYDKKGFIPGQYVFNSPDGDVLISTRNGFYRLKRNALTTRDSLSIHDFDMVGIHGLSPMHGGKYKQVLPLDTERILLVGETSTLLINFKSLVLEKTLPLSDIDALTTWNDDLFVVFDTKVKKVKCIHLKNNEVTYPFENLCDQYGHAITSTFTSAARLNTDECVFTTDGDGIYIYNQRMKTLFNHRHDVINPYSISNNRQKDVLVGENGWVFFICNPSGISYYNQHAVIKSQHIFSDQKGNAFDGYVSALATKDNNTYFIGTSDGLLQWKRNTNSTHFINFNDANGNPLFKNEEVQSVVFDGQDRIWAATTTQGIIILNQQLQLVRQIHSGTHPSRELKLKTVRMLTRSPDGAIWACGEHGVCKIDPQSFEVDNFIQDTLSRFDGSFCYPLFFADSTNLWFGSRSTGLVHYRLDTKQCTAYTQKSGLIHNTIFAINQDRYDNLFIGTIEGLNILTASGNMLTITPKDGLLFNRVEAILFDRHERIWIENDIGLICYSVREKTFRTFNERNGISIFGFRVDANLVAPNGEFVMGTPKGIQYFHPDSLYNQHVRIHALIYRIQTGQVDAGVHGGEKFEFSPDDNNIIFSFETIEYAPHIRTFFQYRLEGADKNWIRIADQNSVSYNGLPSGKYTFRLQVSRDGFNWQEADNQVEFTIATPLYNTSWFLLLVALMFTGTAIYIVTYYRKRQIEKQNILETELVITYFASQINSHKNTDLLLWDIAKNCISRLHFHECIIYLLDENKEFLVQKAAFGPKNTDGYRIDRPINIPVGHGITGSVAKTGVAEIVNDTNLDARYIVDDKRRNAELAVPIIVDNHVLGVIDSEHPQRNFFTKRHKQILETIAFLCANQLQKIKADEEKQSATIELLENKQKAAESKLQSLRLQMNPHFLFNALNSIQQMILANEDVIATRYLSRFSKLLRSILVYSDKELISLKDEIEMLKLYVELESIRFKESFTYSITCDKAIETEEIMIPSLLIQPFVENAIWHGLMHKEGNRVLTISFSEQVDFLQCVVVDNGIGRQAAKQANSSSGRDKKHTSKGISVSEERLKGIRNGNGKTGYIDIIDLTDESGKPSGTKIVINFSILN